MIRYRGNRYMSAFPKAPPAGIEWNSIFNKPAVFVQTNVKIMQQTRCKCELVDQPEDNAFKNVNN